MSSSKQRVRLVGIEKDTSFVYSERTLFDAWTKKYKKELRQNEVVLFVAKSQNQLLFVFRKVEVAGHHGVVTSIYDSRRWRLENGTWHDYMLQNYAEAVGLELVGIKRLEEILAEKRAAK